MSDLRARNAGPQPGDLGLPPSLRGERVNQKESVVDSIFSKRNLGVKAAIAVFVLIVLAYVTVQGNVAIDPMRRTAQGAAIRMPRRPTKVRLEGGPRRARDQLRAHMDRTRPSPPPRHADVLDAPPHSTTTRAWSTSCPLATSSPRD